MSNIFGGSCVMNIGTGCKIYLGLTGYQIVHWWIEFGRRFCLMHDILLSKCIVSAVSVTEYKLEGWLMKSWDVASSNQSSAGLLCQHRRDLYYCNVNMVEYFDFFSAWSVNSFSMRMYRPCEYSSVWSRLSVFSSLIECVCLSTERRTHIGYRAITRMCTPFCLWK